MKKEINSNSFVVIANTHNPSVLSESFLLKSGIISDLQEIKQDSLIITPQFSQIILLNDDTIQLDSGRLNIVSKFSDRPYIMGQKYCKSLEHVKGSAIGVNFEVQLTDYDFDEWFKINKNDADIKCVEKKFRYLNCNITIKHLSTNTVSLNFNFHYDLDNSVLGDIELDFKSEWNQNQNKIDLFIEKVF